MGALLMELWVFMRERKKFWLLPIITILVLFGSLIAWTQGSGVGVVEAHHELIYRYGP